MYPAYHRKRQRQKKNNYWGWGWDLKNIQSFIGWHIETIHLKTGKQLKQK
jgi:hypothetical protein